MKNLREICAESIMRKLNIDKEEAENYMQMPCDEQRRYVERITGKKLTIAQKNPLLDSAYTVD